MFYPAGPQNPPYLNEYGLPSLSPCSDVYWYVYESFYPRSFLSFTFVHFLSFRCFALLCHKIRNECGLPSLSLFGAAYWYIYKSFYRFFPPSSTFIFYPPDFEPSVTQYFFFLFPFSIYLQYASAYDILSHPSQGCQHLASTHMSDLPSGLLPYNMCTELIQYDI